MEAQRLAAFLGAMLATVLLVPIARWVALRTGLVDHPAPHKFHANPTPYLGGMAVAAAVVAGLVGVVVAEPALRAQLVAIAAGAALMAAVGLADDVLTLARLPRLVAQALAAGGLWVAGIRLTPSGIPPVDLAATILLVLALTNAVNLMDNMDGLAAGTVAIAALFLEAAALHAGQRIVPLAALLVAGGCAGFLPYNLPPARIFLGDAGTLCLGFLLSVLVIMLKVPGAPLVTRAAVPLSIVFVPLFDMTLVVVSRWRGGRALFLGGTDHSSHRMAMLGASPFTVALATYAAVAATGGLGLAALYVDRASFSWALGGLLAVTGIGLVWALERVYARWGTTRLKIPSASADPNTSAGA